MSTEQTTECAPDDKYNSVLFGVTAKTFKAAVFMGNCSRKTQVNNNKYMLDIGEQIILKNSIFNI